jgi:predicted DNA-binding protein
MKKEKRSIQIGVRISRTMKQQLARIAEADERTVGSLIYKIIKDYLNQLNRETLDAQE